MKPRRDDRGLSPAVEAVILVPLVMVLMATMVAGHRLWQSRTDLTQLAAAAARAGTQASSGIEALARIHAVVGANAGQCPNPGVEADVSDFAHNGPGAVMVTLRCSVRLADLGVPGLPGAITVTGRGSAPLDTYRTRRR